MYQPINRCVMDAPRQDLWELVFAPMFKDKHRDLEKVFVMFGIAQSCIGNLVIAAKNAYHVRGDGSELKARWSRLRSELRIVERAFTALGSNDGDDYASFASRDRASGMMEQFNY